MDMLIAFFSENLKEYTDIQGMRNALGGLVREGFDLAEDEEQDYFLSRSQYISEIALREAPMGELRSVVLRFFEAVPPPIIARYNLFQRRAYDADLMKRIFVNPDQGKSFYERLFERDQNFYHLQQGALYLMHKKRFEEAFAWIDRAIRQSGGGVWAIRNSHAIILFRANVGKSASNPAVRELLDESMKILTDCINKDKRKIYHSKVFADHALQYFQVYGDNVAADYLQQSMQWLTSERDSGRLWSRSSERLLRQVQTAVSQSRRPKTR